MKAPKAKYKRPGKTLTTVSAVLVALTLSGCTIGVKERVVPIWLSHEPIPESINGVPVIHTDKPIPVTIKDKNLLFKVRLDGMVPVPAALYDRMLKAYNAGRK